MKNEMTHVRLVRAIIFSFALLLGLSQSGCSVFSTIGGWISHGYDNTVAYFNAYYNAKALFDEAEAEVLAARAPYRSKSAATSQMTSMQPIQQSGSSAKQKFTAVIDKCSHILSFYPTSSVVGDALFLVGKSYFYQDEFVRAERKFTELIVQDPNGPLYLEAQLWLLKTLQRLSRYDDANRVGDELVQAATAAEENQIAGEALGMMGEMAQAQEKPAVAIEILSKAVSVADDGPIRAEAQTRIGDIYASLLEYDKAATAYVEVAKYSPDAYGLYNSQLQAAIASRKAKQFDAAIEILRQLQDDYRFMDFWSTIRFELGAVYAESGRLMEAVDQYRLVDTTYARTEQGARAAFELGKLFQLQLGDYAEAKIAFSHGTVGGPPDITQECTRRATALDKYFRLSNQFMKLDSIYFILDIDSLWMQVDSAALQKRSDTLRTKVDTVTNALENVPSGGVVDSSSQKKDTITVTSGSKELPFILVKPKKDTLLASMKNASFQLGELFYTDLEAPDSTFLWLNQALKLGLDSARSARALYVLAEVARENPEKKYGDEKELYRRIIERYPNSSYAEEAGIWLGLPPKPKNVDPARAVFAAAESLMTAGRYNQALDSLTRIVKDYPGSPLTPKSHYTMAWIYEHDLSMPDSALSQFKVLTAKHATTKYGEAATKRIPPVVVDSSKKATPAQQGALNDSTGQLQRAKGAQPVPDTLGARIPPPRMIPDTLRRPEEADEVKPLRKMPSDSSATRRSRKEVID